MVNVHEERRTLGHVVERDPVAVGVRILELPPRHELLDLFPQCAVGLHSAVRCTAVGMGRHLRQHAHHRRRHRLPRRLRRRLHELHHRVHGHALRRVVDELTALPHVAAHGEQSLERVGRELAHELAHALGERGRVAASLHLELFGDLQQVADHHLVVRRVALGLLDRLRDHLGVGRRRVVLVHHHA